ncbi:MAG: caspase family protein, partial [Pseudorhodoplanes sp.]
MRRLATILCGITAAFTLFCSDARAEKRVALVVGNGAYQNVGTLANPVNDAKAVAQMFRDAGFEVVEARTDLGNLEFKRVAREFTSLTRDADIAVLFYAGHGIEVNGTNYLIPVDAKLATDFDVEDESLSLDRLVRALEPARRLRLVILDACRDNPFVKKMVKSSGTR